MKMSKIRSVEIHLERNIVNILSNIDYFRPFNAQDPTTKKNKVRTKRKETKIRNFPLNTNKIVENDKRK